jgi:uncharacterized MnhB-related membrane protein
MVLQTALLIGMVLFSVLAILLKDVLRSAIALAVASLLLGIVFFRMGAPYAGVFEISVVAGLITVLFILTIALTRKGDEVRESRLANWVFPLAFGPGGRGGDGHVRRRPLEGPDPRPSRPDRRHPGGRLRRPGPIPQEGQS